MTVQLKLPKDIELRLVAEVDAGRHASVEAAILEKVSRSDDPDLLIVTGMDEAALRRDLDDAWNDRSGAIAGKTLIDQLAAKSESLRAEGR
jgi:hypothetical protein